MKEIWKYVINPCGVTKIEVPIGSKFLSIGKQKDSVTAQLVVWFEIEHSMENIHYYNTIAIHTMLTGEKFDLPGTYRFIGTVELRDDPSFVIHAYLNDNSH